MKQLDLPFETKDTGERTTFAGGMQREPTDKEDWTLVLDGPMLLRWVQLLTRGARKYSPRNWTLALDATSRGARCAVKTRYRQSALRHMMQWAGGERDEDHAAAVMFNLNGYEAMLATDDLGTED